MNNKNNNNGDNQSNLNQNNNYNEFNNQTLNNSANNTNNTNNNVSINNQGINENNFNNLNSNNQYNSYNNIINDNLTNNIQQNGINNFQNNIVQNGNHKNIENSYENMTNNNNNYNINDSKNKASKSKGFWFGIFAAEIVVFIVLIILATNSLINTTVNKNGSDLNNFITVSQNNGYTVINITDTHGNYDYVNNYYIAMKENIVIEYIEYIDNNYSYYNYLDTKKQIQSIEGKVTTKMSNIESNNYNRYEITKNGITYIVARSSNTFLYTSNSNGNIAEINQMFTNLGYSGNIGFNIWFYLVFILIFTITIIVYWKIFIKAGEKGWKALIPLYNVYIMFKIAFGKGRYFFLMIIPIVNFVIIFMLWYKLAKAFGKSNGFAILNIFLSFFTLQIIAFDNSEYLLKK